MAVRAEWLRYASWVLSHSFGSLDNQFCSGRVKIWATQILPLQFKTDTKRDQKLEVSASCWEDSQGIITPPHLRTMSRKEQQCYIPCHQTRVASREARNPRFYPWGIQDSDIWQNLSMGWGSLGNRHVEYVHREGTSCFIPVMRRSRQIYSMFTWPVCGV